MHYTLDYTYQRLETAASRCRKYERSEEIIGKLICLRQTLYGDHYDGLLSPKLNLVAIQMQLKKTELAIENCESGIETAKAVLSREYIQRNVSSRIATTKILGDFYYTLQSIYGGIKDYPK